MNDFEIQLSTSIISFTPSRCQMIDLKNEFFAWILDFNSLSFRYLQQSFESNGISMVLLLQIEKQ